MPLLGALLVNLFSGLAGFFGAFVSAKVAATLAAITAIGTAFAALTAIIAAGVAGIAHALPSHPMIATAWWLGIPDNGPACMAFVLLVDGSIAVYHMATNQARLVAGAL